MEERIKLCALLRKLAKYDPKKFGAFKNIYIKEV